MPLRLPLLALSSWLAFPNLAQRLTIKSGSRCLLWRVRSWIFDLPIVGGAVVLSHRRRNSHRNIAVGCGLHFDLADDAALFGEEKRRAVRKVEEHLHPLRALEQIGYFHEHLFLRSRVEQGEIPGQRREVEDHFLRLVIRCGLQQRFGHQPDHVGNFFGDLAD